MLRAVPGEEVVGCAMGASVAGPRAALSVRARVGCAATQVVGEGEMLAPAEVSGAVSGVD